MKNSKTRKPLSVLLAVLMLMSVFSMLTVESFAASEKEPNDSFSAATQISTNTNNSGNLSKSRDLDYYKFTLYSDGHITLTFSHQMLDTTSYVWNAVFYDAQQNKISEYAFSGNLIEDTEEIGLAKGTYYLKLERCNYNNDGVHINYSFNLRYKATSYWEKEGNDAFSKANSVVLNKKYTANLWNSNDNDYFKFTLSSDGYISMLFTHEKLDTTNGVWRATVYDAQQSKLFDCTFSGNLTEDNADIGLDKGTYYLKIERCNYNNDGIHINYGFMLANPTFPDVRPNAWFYDAVEYVAQKGYITGYSNGRFGPNDSLKRQDFVCILARIAKADLSKYQNTASKLKDVKKGEYYAPAVNWAVDNGIIAGYNNGKFGVNDPITREQVAVILYRYMKEPAVSNPANTLAKFSDANRVSPFATTALAWAVNKGVINGTSDGRVNSTKAASRAEIAAIIMNMDKAGMFKK